MAFDKWQNYVLIWTAKRYIKDTLAAKNWGKEKIFGASDLNMHDDCHLHANAKHETIIKKPVYAHLAFIPWYIIPLKEF